MVDFKEVRKGILYYGSPDVINSFIRWQLKIEENNIENLTDPEKPYRDMGDVILAMRKDVGLSNRGFDNLSINQIYISDNLSDLKKIDLEEFKEKVREKNRLGQLEDG